MCVIIYRVLQGKDDIVASFIDKLFNVDKKRLDEVIKKARPVETYAEQMANLSDEELIKIVDGIEY